MCIKFSICDFSDRILRPLRVQRFVLLLLLGYTVTNTFLSGRNSGQVESAGRKHSRLIAC